MWMMGETISGRVPTPAMLDGWSMGSKVMTCPDHSRGLGGVEMTVFSSRMNLLYTLLEGGREAPPWMHPTTPVISWNLPLLPPRASRLLARAAS